MIGSLRCTLLALALLLAGRGAAAGTIIAHPSVELDIAEVRDLFLGERLLQGKLKLVPVNNAANFDEFLSAVLQSDARQFTARWRRKSFREGLLPPPMLASDAEVIAFVRATPGAVGYVSGSPQDVKVLAPF